jgi:GNAT superfamily N-acetyltransferase
MQFVDRALARRFESAEEMPQVYHAYAAQKLQPEIGAAVAPIAGGHMIFAGLGSPIGRAVGMGFCVPVTEADFDQLEDFYYSRKAPAQLDYCPLTDTSLLEIARKRGYQFAELNQVLALGLWSDGRPSDSAQGRPRPSEALAADVPGFQIRPGRLGEARIFSAIVRESFFPSGGEPAGFDEMLVPMFSFPGAITFVAECEGKLVATGAGLIIRDHKIVALFGAGTLKPYRGRGLQTAMLGKRLALAAQAGCEYAVIVTQGGTTSQRNAERMGFRVVYSKATLIKDPPR